MIVTAARNRRHVLTSISGFGMAGLAGCATTSSAVPAPARPGFAPPALAPIRAEAGRIVRITACLRPFRAEGPRLDVEMVGDKRVVHNYGHGGSGWSLSWGSAAIAAANAMEGGTREVAVIGCGALGLTTAILLQQAGVRTTIHAAERAPMTRSARATGTWSPDSRIADQARVAADFAGRWEAMARFAHAKHQTYVGLPGQPVFWQDQYILRRPPAPTSTTTPPIETQDAARITFAQYASRLRGLGPQFRDLTPDEHPFPVPRARLGTSMTFNVAALADRLMTQFQMDGGRIVTRTFHSPSELSSLSEPVVVNCTGYGARALWGDDSVVPVRGQIAWLAPQPEVDYGLYYRGVSVLPRPDGIVIQKLGDSDMWGYGLDDETPDRDEAEESLGVIAALFA